MGKPYDLELELLPHSYLWAWSENIQGLIDCLRATAHLPLIAVGSGGSFSAAELMVSCHQHYVGGLGRAVTPLELISALPQNGQVSVWFFSASGRNVDVKSAYYHALLKEPKNIAALVGRFSSPLVEMTENHAYANLFEFELPYGDDGFLATNSLLAFSTLIARAYSSLYQPTELSALPASVESLLDKAFPKEFQLKNIGRTTECLWGKRSLHVVYAPEFKAVAADIESKFIEAGLCSIHLADIRNFAHGRHHWMDKHPDDSGIIALSTSDTKEVTESTLGLIPSNIPRVHVPVSDKGALGVVAGIVLSMYLTRFAGKSRKIDPGKPGVPLYGTDIYNLSKPTGFVTEIKTEDAAIKRKAGPLLLVGKRAQYWRTAYRTFLTKISETEFGAVVMDYDGTVVDARKKLLPPSRDFVNEVVRLATAGVRIGFATGRGKSIRRDLQTVIPQTLWDRILIGYYNGAEISTLTDNSTPDGTSPPDVTLEAVVTSLERSPELTSMAKIDAKKFQVTLFPNSEQISAMPETFIFDLAQDYLCSLGAQQYDDANLFIYRSSHSIDILAKGVSKVSVIKELEKVLPPTSNILVIGDRGRWPGNDCQLLKHCYSLSVDEVSPCEHTCWNISPAGIRGPQATVRYLQQLQTVHSGSPTVRFVPGDISES